AERAAVLGTRLEPGLAAAVHPDVTPRIERAALGLDVEDPGRPETVLGGERAGEERHRLCQPRAQAAALAEQGRAFRQRDTIDAVLDVAHLVPDVDPTDARR